MLLYWTGERDALISPVDVSAAGFHVQLNTRVALLSYYTVWSKMKQLHESGGVPLICWPLATP